MARPSLSMRPMYGGSLAAAGALQARGLSLWPSSSAPSDSAAAAATTAAEEGAATSSSALPDVAAAQGHGVNEGVSAAGEAVAAQAADGIVNFSDIALSWWPNVKAAQIVTDWVVESTGLPWWANIALVTVGVRILVLPLILRGQANAIRLGNIQPQMQAMIKDMSYAKASGDRALQQDSAARVQKLMADNDCHPMRSLIAPLVQGPIFISFFCALRSFAEQGLTPMKTGGLAWFPDLTSADPNGILPVISAASMLLILETGAEMGGSTQQNTPQAKMTRNVLRGVSVIMIPFIWSFPAVRTTTPWDLISGSALLTHVGHAPLSHTGRLLLLADKQHILARAAHGAAHPCCAAGAEAARKDQAECRRRRGRRGRTWQADGILGQYCCGQGHSNGRRAAIEYARCGPQRHAVRAARATSRRGDA